MPPQRLLGQPRATAWRRKGMAPSGQSAPRWGWPSHAAASALAACPANFRKTEPRAI